MQFCSPNYLEIPQPGPDYYSYYYYHYYYYHYYYYYFVISVGLKQKLKQNTMQERLELVLGVEWVKVL